MKEHLARLHPFLRHVWAQWRLVVGTVAISYLVSGCSVILPLLYKKLTDEGLIGAGGGGEERFDQLVGALVGIFAFLVVRRVAQSCAKYAGSLVTTRAATRVREDLFHHLQCLPLDYFDSTQAGSLVSGITNDIHRLQNLLDEVLTEMFTAPATLIASIALVFWLDPVLGGAALVVFPFLFYLMRKTGPRVRRIARRNQAALAVLASAFLEAVTNVRVVRSFQQQDYEIEKFDRLNAETLRLRMRNLLLIQLVEGTGDLLVILGFIFVLLLSGSRIVQGAVPLGSLVALIAYMLLMRGSLNAMLRLYGAYQSALGGTERLLDMLSVPARVLPEPTGAEPASGWRGELALRDVHFSYADGTVVLRGADLVIAAGEHVAMIGPSGVGKSTIASLILGLYDLNAGSILLDGIDTREIGLRRLVELVSIVPQDIGLFNDTVRGNLRYARMDASDEEIEEACRLANAHEFILGLQQGYETVIGDRGVRLSGGQRQRLAIARAILRNPRFLILDEATSHVDPETEALVQKALRNLLADRTTLIIAHQESAIRDVDRVVALEQGRLRPVNAEALARRA